MDLSNDDMTTIKRLAEGDQSCREEAIAIYRQFIAKHGRTNNVFINYVSEVDNVVPDLGLRGRYREYVIAYEIPERRSTI
jgi:hypothetical protein